MRSQEKLLISKPWKFQRAALGPRKSSPNYSARWAGKYIRVNTTCSTIPTSFLFRHILFQSGAAASLQTSHDGNFSGTSRDKGRRIEFSKQTTYPNGVTCGIAVVYKNLSNNGQVSGNGYAFSCSNGCKAVYGANSIRS